MSDKSPSAFGVIDLLTKVVPAVGAVVLVIYGYAGLNDRQDNQQAEINIMLSHNLLSRVQTLEDDRENDSVNMSTEYESTQGQLQAVEGREANINNSLSTIAQSVATLTAQMQILINKDWPGAKVGP